MGTSTVQVFAYDGNLLSLQTNGLLDVGLLGFGGSAMQAEITDQDGVLTADDSGTATFRLAGDTGPAVPLTYGGAGQAYTLGLLGVRLLPRDISIVEADGQVYIIAPDGLPPLSALLFNVDVDAETGFPLPEFVPCLAAGTLILTPEGERPIEDLRRGDRVLDDQGQSHVILRTGKRDVPVYGNGEDDFAKWAPVRVPQNGFGPGQPHSDLFVSQHHRLVVTLPYLPYPRMFARAKLLQSIGLAQDFGSDRIVWHHILCENHIVIVANGMPTESLLPGPMTRAALGRTAWSEILEIMPELADEAPDYPSPCLPELRRHDINVLAKAGVAVAAE